MLKLADSDFGRALREFTAFCSPKRAGAALRDEIRDLLTMNSIFPGGRGPEPARLLAAKTCGRISAASHSLLAYARRSGYNLPPGASAYMKERLEGAR